MSRSTSKLISEEKKKNKEIKSLSEEIMESETKEEVKEEVEEEVKEEIKEEVETPEVISSEPEIQDIDLSVIQRKRFRINGDNNKILELNTSDLGISYRLPKAYDELNAIMDDVGNTLSNLPDNADDLDDDTSRKIGNALKILDDSMKEKIDYIFDAPVSAICSDGGSMYDPINGMFRYEHIIDRITSLYETNLNKEFTLMRNRVKNRTERYTRVSKKATKKYTR